MRAVSRESLAELKLTVSKSRVASSASFDANSIKVVAAPVIPNLYRKLTEFLYAGILYCLMREGVMIYWDHIAVNFKRGASLRVTERLVM